MDFSRHLMERRESIRELTAAWRDIGNKAKKSGFLNFRHSKT